MLRLGRPFSAAMALAVATTLAAPRATLAAAAPGGGATPQDVVARMTKASETKNFGEMVSCLDPASRTELTMGLLAATTMMVAFMGMGADMASGMAEGMSEAVSGSKPKAEDKAKIAKSKAEAAAKITKTKTAFSALLKKHGLPDLMDEKATLPQDKGAAGAMLAKVDQAALATDLFAFMDQIGDKKEGAAPDKGPMSIPSAVTDYKITGDTATAKADGKPMDFVKIDGRWYLKMPDQKAGQ